MPLLLLTSSPLLADQDRPLKIDTTAVSNLLSFEKPEPILSVKSTLFGFKDGSVSLLR